MRSLSIVIGVALLSLATGCNQSRASGPSFSFTRPELLDFVCFGKYRQLDAKEDGFFALPRRCCRQFDPARDEATPPLDPVCTTVPAQPEGPQLTPVLHALLSQSTRGEIASIDLAQKKVIDISKRLPGASFRDSGGLPVALVTPRKQPRSAAEVGPEWTYVANAESLEVRAIPNVCFVARVGGASANGVVHDCAAPQPALPLPGIPGDMILAPEGTPEEALWVTLPEEGLLARIELGELPSEPFAATPIRYYRVSPAPSATPPEPTVEPEYLATCGLGVPFADAPLNLPRAPRAAPSSTVRPTRLHYDEESGLLLVADADAPVLHAFAFGADATLLEHPALPTGFPVRDFALTARVPALAAMNLQVPALPPVPGPDADAAAWKRYLYAIEDGGEGLVMAFEFAAPGGGALPQLTPLAFPVSHDRYADRLRARSPAVALAIIDTRDRTPGDGELTGTTYVCGQELGNGGPLPANLVDEARKNRDARRGGDAREFQRVDARYAIIDGAGPRQLRGVFLTIAVADGQIAVFDIYDLDVACRAAEECSGDGLIAPVHPDRQDAVAIRRHAPRLVRTGKIEARINSGNASALVPTTCGPGQRSVLSVAEGSNPAGARDLVCVPSDPWSQSNERWRVANRGNYGAILGAAIEADQPFGEASLVPSPGPNELTLHAPRGVDLCTTGVEVGDFVAFTGMPAARARDCPKPTESSARANALRVVQAFSDGLVLAAPDERERARLRRCYPDSTDVVSLLGREMVVVPSSVPRHRVVAGEGGRCVVDETRDPLLTIRPTPEGGPLNEPLRYSAPNVSFSVAAPGPAAMGDGGGASTVSTTSDLAIALSNAPAALSVTNADSRVVDALPFALRYVPEDNSLFAVDTGSQGLRRYTVQPFEWDDDSIYR